MKQNATLDSSFWVNAHRSGLLPSVLARFDLRYSSVVASELRPSFPSGEAFWDLVGQGTIAEANARESHVTEFGPGERAAIDVAYENSDWVLLLDDHRPFQEAVRLGLRVLCTPVFTVALYAEGSLTAYDTLLILGRLAVLQTVSPHLLAMALAQLGRMPESRRGG
jgi:predicted nucleic acid-binding protein